MTGHFGGVQGRVGFDFRTMLQPPAPHTVTTTPLASSPAAHRRRWLLATALCISAVVAAHVADRWAWTAMRNPQVYEHDWGRLLRMVGYLPTWIIIAVGCWTHDRPRATWPDTTLADTTSPDTTLPDTTRPHTTWPWRGGLLIAAPALGGAVAEVLKLCFRRLRPDAEHFGYVFRSFDDHPFANGGLGMPSSHTLVAFSGAAAMAAVFPKARWLWFALAAGCALTRVMTVAHFLSDAVVAAIIGTMIGTLLAPVMLSRAHARTQ